MDAGVNTPKHTRSLGLVLVSLIHLSVQSTST